MVRNKLNDKYKEDRMSNCCNAQVYDPSGLGIEGRCKDCLEMCLIVKEAE